MNPTHTAIIANAVFCHRILVLLMSVETFSPVTDCRIQSLLACGLSGGQDNIPDIGVKKK